MKHKLSKLLFLVGSLLLAGCGGGGNGSSATIKVTPAESTIKVDESVTLTATYSGGSGDVTWLVKDTNIVTIDKNSGPTIKVTGKTVGETLIKAKYDTVSYSVYIEVTEKGVTPPDPDPDPTGNTGSVDSPFTPSEACAYARTLGKDEQSTLKYFIKGKLVNGSFDGSGIASYGNATFSISDDGSSTNAFYCFQVYYLNAQKFKTTESISNGDTVTIFSAIVNYKGTTPETTNKGSAYVYAHNNKKSSTVPDQGLPAEDPKAKVVTISALISENSSWKTEGAKSSTLYRISGTAQYANNTNWGNLDLTDSTGYIAIHGCVGTKKGLVNDGSNGMVIDNDKSYSALGIKAGDTITIEGWYAYHKYSNSYGIPQFTGYVTKLTHNNLSNITGKDYTGTEPYSGSYYSSVTETSGLGLLTQLHNLMDSSHKTYTSYSSLENYFKSTDPHPNGNIKCFYSGESHTVKEINREHVWPQSLSGSSSSQLYGEDYGGSDLHHLRPALTAYNSNRGNSMFGGIYGSGGYRTISYQGGGQVKYVSGVFEPADSMKGDVARIIMYMYMHYNDGTISDLKDKVTGWNTKGWYGEMHINWVMAPSSVSDCFKLLRQWNADDPVSQEEINRNDYTYGIQGNRNPFIDHPKYADMIWG